MSTTSNTHGNGVAGHPAPHGDHPAVSRGNSRARRGNSLLYAGVFFLFSPVGLLFTLIGEEKGTWSAATIVALFSGLVAIGWAYSFSSRRYWVLALVVPLSFLVPMTLFPLLGRAGWFDYGAAVGNLGRGLTIAIMAIAGMSVGFTFMVRHIQRQESAAAGARAELDIASRIHASLVPAIDLRLGNTLVAGLSAASSSMGGDLIDALVRENPASPDTTPGEVDVFLADVSGHGVGAGIVMGMLKASLRTRLLTGGPLADVLTDLNLVLSDLTRPEMFATLACVRVSQTGRAEFALAGHLPILHYSAPRNAWTQLENQHLPLGIVPEERYTGGAIHLDPGDALVLFTDGLIEVQDSRGRELGLERFIDAITRAAVPRQDAASSARDLLRVAAAHGPPLDDQSVLIVRRL